MLAFSTDADEEETRRSVILTPRNVGLAAAMVALFAWFWLWHLDLTGSTLVVIAGVLIALPLVLQDSAGDAARDRAIAVTKRSLILALWGLVAFVYLFFDRGVWTFGLAAVCVVLPLALAASRAWGARRGRIELGLLRHPLRREVRAYLVQGLNVWLCCGLLWGVLAAGGVHYGRVGHSLNADQFDVEISAFVAGLVLLAALAVVPRRRVYAAINVVVALLSGFLALQLVQMSASPSGAVVLDSPLAGEWFVLNGGRSVLLNGHSPNEGNAVDFLRLGANGRTHTGGSGAPLADYPGFGLPVLAPADGRIVEVTDGHTDNPPGTNGDYANHLVVDVGGGRYVSMAHLKQGSVTVQVSDVVRRGQPLAAVGNNGHSNEPHLHMQVQDSPAGTDADRTYPMVFRNVHITRGGAWPWGDSRESFAPATSSGRSGGDDDDNVEPGPAPRFTAGGEPAVGSGLRRPPGGVQCLSGRPARPGRRPLPGRRRDGTPAVPGCRFPDPGVPRRPGLHDDDLGQGPRRPRARCPHLRLGLPRRGPIPPARR